MRWSGGFCALLAVIALGGTLMLPTRAVAQGMVLFIEITKPNPVPTKPSAPIDSIQDLLGALSKCWSPPDGTPEDVTFQISYKRTGELFGKPLVITFTRPVTPELRARYYTAVAEALDRCSSLPFTERMGGATAGRVLRINILDRRNAERAEIYD
jgi:hypothetical protein